MIFINTRPKIRANSLTDFLQTYGINVLEIPLLELVACELSESEKFYLKNLTQTEVYQAIIFISETAVSYFFDFIQTHHIPLNLNLTVITIGQKTAQSFENSWHNFYPTLPNLITPSQFNLPENNEGLAQLPIIKELKKGGHLLLLKGKAGRTLLKNVLIERGIVVHEVDFYQRIFPLSSIQVFQQHFLNYPVTQKIIVLITSLTAWQHWQKILSTLPKVGLNFYYLVLQSRIAKTVIDSSPNVTILSSLEPSEILIKINLLA